MSMHENRLRDGIQYLANRNKRYLPNIRTVRLRCPRLQPANYRCLRERFSPAALPSPCHKFPPLATRTLRRGSNLRKELRNSGRCRSRPRGTRSSKSLPKIRLSLTAVITLPSQMIMTTIRHRGCARLCKTARLTFKCKKR